MLMVAYVVMGYFGYEPNKEYFTQSKSQCQDLLKQCRDNLIHQGLDNVKCEYQCIDPKLFIQKKPQ